MLSIRILLKILAVQQYLIISNTTPRYKVEQRNIN